MLSLGVGPGGEITQLYSFFVVGVLHLITAVFLASGGLYHSIIGNERLEETTLGSLSTILWVDRFRITAILGVHLVFLGLGSLTLFDKAITTGLYDTWAGGGGDVQLIKELSVNYNPYVLVRYLLRAPFGSEGWMISMNSMEDLTGGVLLGWFRFSHWWYLAYNYSSYRRIQSRIYLVR